MIFRRIVLKMSIFLVLLGVSTSITDYYSNNCINIFAISAAKNCATDDSNQKEAINWVEFRLLTKCAVSISFNHVMTCYILCDWSINLELHSVNTHLSISWNECTVETKCIWIDYWLTHCTGIAWARAVCEYINWGCLVNVGN